MLNLFKKTALSSAGITSNDVKQYRLTILRDSASKLVDFVCSLTQSQLREFWLPCRLNSSSKEPLAN
jgi:hypothetical protein